MNKIINLTIALVLAVLATGCSDDRVGPKGEGWLEPGTPVELSLGLEVPESKTLVTATRASTGTPISRQTYDLYVFIFNEDTALGETGILKSKYFFPAVQEETEIQCDPLYSSTASATVNGSVLRHVHTTAGRSRIVAVANCDRIASAMIAPQLNGIRTYDELKAIMISSLNVTGSPDIDMPLAVMSGYYEGEETEEGVTGIGSQPLTGTIVLAPMRSKVKFVVYSDGHEAAVDEEGRTIPAGRFTMSSWQVVNIPSVSPLIDLGANAPDATMLSSEPNPKFEAGREVVDENGTASADPDVQGFAFFMPASHPGRGKEISTYAERTVWDTSAGVATAPEDKKYTNAPSHATYVVIRGKYTGASLVTEPEGSEEETTVRNVATEVTYTVFLGHNSATDFADYETLRNYNYTYVLRVKGVNTITVEVNRNKESRPDYEGHVIASETPGYTLDAHYEQRTVEFSKHAIEACIAGGNMQVAVTVPMFGVDNRVYSYCDRNGIVDDSDPDGALPYMGWVEFYRHKESEKERDYIPYTDARGTGVEPATMDARGFLADLYEFANDPGANDDDTRKYTLYFDEYLYTADPGNPNLSVSWQDVLRNGSPRTLTMLGSTSFSADRNSSYSTLGTVFSQRCMQTVYDLDNPTLKYGWATECVEEDLYQKGDPTVPFGTFKLHPRPIDGGTVPSSIYGRQNCWAVTYGPGNTLWHFNRQIGEDGYMLKPAANNIDRNPDAPNLYTVCMQRNRDLNGNGLIDRDEVKWYLPSLNQMEVLYVGFGALSDDVMLFNPNAEEENIDYDKMTYPVRHYATSQGDQKFWAEEGCSNSVMGLGNPPAWNKDTRFFVRCVRDLGVDRNLDTNYEHIYKAEFYDKVKDQAAGKVTMAELSRRSCRNYLQLIDLPGLVTTFSESSFPAYEFEWADTVFHSEVTIAEDFAAAMSVPQGVTQCNKVLGKGWRLPTLSELVEIYWAMDKDGNRMIGNNNMARLATRTQFYYKDMGLSPVHNPNNPRMYHMFDKTDLKNMGQFTLNKTGDEKTVLYMRCVRDVAR